VVLRLLGLAYRLLDGQGIARILANLADRVLLEGSVSLIREWTQMITYPEGKGRGKERQEKEGKKAGGKK